jgi:hypothetical protein
VKKNKTSIPYTLYLEPYTLPLLFLALHKPADGSVIGFFSALRKITGRQLSIPPVIMQTLAA